MDVLPGRNTELGVPLSRQGRRALQMTIARYPDMSLRAAREERDKLAAQAARGEPPAHDMKEQKEREEGRGAIPRLRNSQSAGIAN